MPDIKKANPMPSQEPSTRRRNFKEVALGYDAKTAVAEAKRCLNCKNKPCVAGCPVSIAIPEFIKFITEGEFEKAYQKILESSSLPAVCGRVCPQESQCQLPCTRGKMGDSVAIGRLERFVADYHREHIKENIKKVEKNGKKVAVIGSGPSCLACANDLARAGYAVTMFEALHIPGGVLTYGIPEFRLPKTVVNSEINNLKSLGVDIETNVIVGKSIMLDEIRREYDAVFIGSGAGLPRFMNIPGENLNNVYSANEFLTRVNLMKAYRPGSRTPIHRGKRVAVVGGGNVAMDSSRCALRLGADKVYIIYRRTEKEMPARNEEIEHAKEEGIEFLTLNNPTEILGNDNFEVSGIKCVKMELGEPDESGRRRPYPIEGSEHTLDVDTVIMALGTSPNPMIKRGEKDLKTDARGRITTDEKGMTSVPGIFAGGDAVTGAATVIKAMGAGRKAASAIMEYLK